MTIDRLPEHNPTTPPLTKRNPGRQLAVLALTDQLDAERVAHAATRRELAATRRRLLGALVAGRIAEYGRSVYAAWALPQVGGGVPPAPDEPVGVDLSAAPLIYDALVVELGADPAVPAPEQPSVRRRGPLAVGMLLLAVAALLTRKASR